VAFEWDEGNEEHIAHHGVTSEEVEEAFFDPARLTVDVYNTTTERRRGLLGRTEDGRLLFVVYTRRAQAVRVVTARDASERHRRRYERAVR
jgi:uncharacterized protein